MGVEGVKLVRSMPMAEDVKAAPVSWEWNTQGNDHLKVRGWQVLQQGRMVGGRVWGQCPVPSGLGIMLTAEDVKDAPAIWEWHTHVVAGWRLW